MFALVLLRQRKLQRLTIQPLVLKAGEKKQSLKKWSQGLKNGTAAGPNFFAFFLLVVQRLCSGFFAKNYIIYYK